MDTPPQLKAPVQNRFGRKLGCTGRARVCATRPSLEAGSKDTPRPSARPSASPMCAEAESAGAACTAQHLSTPRTSPSRSKRGPQRFQQDGFPPSGDARRAPRSEELAGLREGPDADASTSPPSGERAGTVRRPEATAPSRRDQDLKPRGSREQRDSMRRPARPVRGEGEGHCRRTTRTEALLQPRRTAVARMLSAASWAVRAPIARQPECQDKGSKVQMSQSKMFGGRAVQKPIAHLGAC